MSENTSPRACRSCKNTVEDIVVDLGEQSLSGVFNHDPSQVITKGSLQLMHCRTCQLVQLVDTFPLDEMYDDGYGYRSGATSLMKNHLKDVVEKARLLTTLKDKDTVLDIGSNDGTLLSFYNDVDVARIGIDPVSRKYADQYPEKAVVVPDFFTAQKYQEISDQKAKIVTSISMFYDLPDPVAFARDVNKILADDGTWVIEMSYLLNVIHNNVYDSICHEHLEYYSLHALGYILEQSNFSVQQVETNDLNGGSLRIYVQHAGNRPWHNNLPDVLFLLKQEEAHGLVSGLAFESFNERVTRHREDLLMLLHGLKEAGKKVLGYGASTKGNVILQYCGIGPELIELIGDITPQKDGAFTPGTQIPIVAMEKAKEMKPDYFIVLPWAFKNFIQANEAQTRKDGTKFIYPLPNVAIC